jgi:2-keto-4-pentenoate hydratase
MLQSSKLHSYAHAIKAVESTRRVIAPQASTLGLTLESAIETQAALHMLYTADGLDSVGRKVIAESTSRRALDNPKACLGHHYASRTVHLQDDEIILSTQNSTRLFLEPKLVLKFSQTPDTSTSLEQFTQMFESVALGIEILKAPFKGDAWSFEDKICSNGMGHMLVIGEAKTLSEKRKRNFSDVLNHATFSLNKVSKQTSQLLSFASGRNSVMSSISELYEVFLRHLEIDQCSPFHQNDLISLNALCAPIKATSGDEYICVASGIDLVSVRARLAH